MTIALCAIVGNLTGKYSLMMTRRQPTTKIGCLLCANEGKVINRILVFYGNIIEQDKNS